jgi:hypothetical protein
MKILPGEQFEATDVDALIHSHWSSRSPYRVIGQAFAKADRP